MIKAIIFDFFGVIVGDGFDTTYKHAGGNPETDKHFIAELLEQVNRDQINVKTFRDEICGKLNISREEYDKAINEAEQTNSELLGYIKVLRKKYKTALLSNVNKGGLEQRISREVLDEHFDTVVVSGEVGYIKPEREIYELTASKLEVKPNECVFIDDRAGYVKGAEAAGMEGFVYKDFEHFKAQLEVALGTSVTDN